MSKLAVANIIFETTESNRIEYTGNNVVRVRANGGLQIPFGTTAQRVSPEYGLIRYNTDTGTVEMYDAGGWFNTPTGGYVNNIYTVANSAYALANNVSPQLAPAFNTANVAFDTANAAFASANNVAPQVTPSFNTANSAFNTANAAFASANNVAPQVTPAFLTANSAYSTANAAYAAANTKFASSGGTISGGVEISGDLTVRGNTRFIDQQTLAIGDSLIYLAANNYSSDVVDIGFIANYVNTTSVNVHTGLFRSSGTKEYYLFQGYDKEPINNYIDPTGNNITMAVLNSTVRTSNLILGGANTINWITSLYNSSNADYVVSNSAFATVNAAYASINSNWTVTNTVYGVANAAYNAANNVNLSAPFNVANAAFAKANNALANTTGTFAGNLTVAGGSITGATQSTYALSLGNVGGLSGDMAFGSDASYGYVQTWNSKPLCINNQGNNVGIGGAPSYKLHVVGTGYASSDFRAPIFYDSNDTSYYANPAGTSNIVALTLNPGASGINTGLVVSGGDITAARTSTTGVIYFGTSDGSKYLYHDGSNYYFGSTGYVNIPNSTRSPIFYDSNNTGYYADPASTSVLNAVNTYQLTLYNNRVSYSQQFSPGHYASGDTVFEFDPTWTNAQLQSYFNSGSVSWVADSTAPAGYAISITGAVNAGGNYNSGFPYIQVETDDIFYMECWIKTSSGTPNHYMGSIDYDHNLSLLGGNPGSFGYWVMSGYSSTASWTKVSGYVTGFATSGSPAGTFPTGTKYFTPQALFNYSGGNCYISGWKCVRVNHRGNRTFNGSIKQDTFPFIEHTSNITSSYTITTNYNAMTAGPVTINTGVSVTIPTGSNWVVL